MGKGAIISGYETERIERRVFCKIALEKRNFPVGCVIAGAAKKGARKREANGGLNIADHRLRNCSDLRWQLMASKKRLPKNEGAGEPCVENLPHEI